MINFLCLFFATLEAGSVCINFRKSTGIGADYHFAEKYANLFREADFKFKSSAYDHPVSIKKPQGNSTICCLMSERSENGEKELSEKPGQETTL